MKLELKDMQISKVEIQQRAANETGLKQDENILNPTSFALIIKRNLSSGWYKEIPELDVSARLKSIVVSIKCFCVFRMKIIHNKNWPIAWNKFAFSHLHR